MNGKGWMRKQEREKRQERMSEAGGCGRVRTTEGEWIFLGE